MLSPPKRRSGRRPSHAAQKTPGKDAANNTAGRVLGGGPVCGTRAWRAAFSTPQQPYRQLTGLHLLILVITIAIASGVIAVYLANHIFFPRPPSSSANNPITPARWTTLTITSTTIVTSICTAPAPPSMCSSSRYIPSDTAKVRDICLPTARIMSPTSRPPGSVTLHDFFQGRAPIIQQPRSPDYTSQAYRPDPDMAALVPAVQDRHAGPCDAGLTRTTGKMYVTVGTDDGVTFREEERINVLVERSWSVS